MQEDPNKYDIKIYLADIERSIQEIYDFLPAQRDFNDRIYLDLYCVLT